MRFGRFLSGGAFTAGLVAGVLALAFWGVLETRAQQTAGSGGLSHVRVVRLSFIEGKAAIRVPGSDQWTEATVNTPIQEGFSVSTDEKSFAEVQFENGSTVRLGAVSIIDFTQLALTPQGGHINHMALEQGYATFDVSPARHDEYVLGVAGVNVTAEGKSEFRADAGDERMRLEVFSGSVRAADASHTETLGQNHALVRDNDAAASFQISDKIEQDDWDKWVRGRSQQSTLAMKDAAITPPSGPMYGWDDLDVYGEWSYFPGYGNAWAPYEPAGWSPYSAGMWGSYPGMGYTWISAEPWGWLPFHYGFWNFDAQMGWFWMPGEMAAWNPALVNWYSGPGWIGWSPIGAAGFGGAAPCTMAVAGCLMAVSPNVLSNRERIEAGSATVVHPRTAGGITPIVRPEVVPARSTAAARVAFPQLTSVSNGRNGAGPNGSRPAAPIGFARGPEGAPSSVLMGTRPEARAFGERSALNSSSGKIEPMRVRLGSTMGGGRFFGTPGEGTRDRTAMPGGQPRERAGVGPLASAPRILPRTSLGGVARAWSRSEAGNAAANMPRGAVGGIGLRSAGAAGGRGRSGGSSSGGSSGGGGHH